MSNFWTWVIIRPCPICKTRPGYNRAASRYRKSNRREIIYGYTECTLCAGSWYIRITRCSTCKTKGNRRCTECFGELWVYEPNIICPNCYGWGKKGMFDCLRCLGEGTIPRLCEYCCGRKTLGKGSSTRPCNGCNADGKGRRY